MFSLKSRQRHTLTSMLTLGVSGSNHKPNVIEKECQWKILIYDTYCRDVLAPLFSVSELNKLGVTLYLLITSKRDVVKQIPALYFIRPTADNVTQVISDINNRLYDKVYLNFTSLPNGFLEYFASRVANETSVTNINDIIIEINNQMTEFVCIEDNLISFHHQYSLPSILQSKELFTIYSNRIISGILTLIHTSGSIPYIHVPDIPNSPAYQIMKGVCRQISSGSISHLKGMSTTATTRWNLLILDRSIHMASGLLQSIDYYPLLVDQGFKSGSITLPSSSSSAPATAPSQQQQQQQQQQTTYEIDSDDAFWRSNRCANISDVAEAVHTTSIKYKNEIALVQNKTKDITKMREAMSFLPTLTKSKQQLDNHLLLCAHLVPIVESRSLHKSSEAEVDATHTSWQSSIRLLEMAQRNAIVYAQQTQQAVSTSPQQQQQPQVQTQQQVPKDIAEGSLSPYDRLRLILILIGCRYPEPAVIDNFLSSLETTMNDGRYPPSLHITSAIIKNSVQYMRSYVQISQFPPSVSSSASSTAISLLSSFTTDKTTIPFTNLVKSYQNLDKVLCVDPITGSTLTSKQQGYAVSSPNLITLMVGGGNYTEYTASQTALSSSSSSSSSSSGSTSIIYATSEMMTPRQFLETISSMNDMSPQTLQQYEMAQRDF